MYSEVNYVIDDERGYWWAAFCLITAVRSRARNPPSLPRSVWFTFMVRRDLAEFFPGIFEGTLGAFSLTWMEEHLGGPRVQGNEHHRHLNSGAWWI